MKHLAVLVCVVAAVRAVSFYDLLKRREAFNHENHPSEVEDKLRSKIFAENKHKIAKHNLRFQGGFKPSPRQNKYGNTLMNASPSLNHTSTLKNELNSSSSVLKSARRFFFYLLKLKHRMIKSILENKAYILFGVTTPRPGTSECHQPCIYPCTNPCQPVYQYPTAPPYYPPAPYYPPYYYPTPPPYIPYYPPYPYPTTASYPPYYPHEYPTTTPYTPPTQPRKTRPPTPTQPRKTRTTTPTPPCVNPGKSDEFYVYCYSGSGQDDTLQSEQRFVKQIHNAYKNKGLNYKHRHNGGANKQHSNRQPHSKRRPPTYLSSKTKLAAAAGTAR